MDSKSFSKNPRLKYLKKDGKGHKPLFVFHKCQVDLSSNGLEASLLRIYVFVH
jgi:hypothetical protein